jgi:hypothetical protein
MVQRIIGGLVAASLTLGSTAAAASSPSPQANPWGLLSVMSGGAPAAAMCGAATVATAAQAPTGCVLPALDAPPAAQPPPPQPAAVPPISAPSPGFGLSPLLLGLLAVAAGIGLYFAVHHHGNSPT